MKFALLVLTIALVAQMAMGGVLQRLRRDIDDDDIPIEAAWKATKLTAQKSGEIVTKTLEKVPKTDAYAKYREALEDVLNDYNAFASKKSLCKPKAEALMQKVMGLDDYWTPEDAPAEAKEVEKYYIEAFGEVMGEEGKKIYEEMTELENNPKKLNHEEETIKGIAITLEVC